MRAFGAIPYELTSRMYDHFPAGRTTGVSIAAIKCMLAFGLYNEFYTKEVSLSLSEIEKVTGCSKPMIVRAVKYLCDQKIITKVTQQKTNVKNKYIVNFGSNKFTQIPYGHLAYSLKDFPNKGITTLVALKAYLILLKLRKNDTSSVEITYSSFSNYHINTRHLNKALAILISGDYISIFKQHNRNETGYSKSCNNYKIRHFYKAVPAPNNKPYLDLEPLI